MMSSRNKGSLLVRALLGIAVVSLLTVLMQKPHLRFDMSSSFTQCSETAGNSADQKFTSLVDVNEMLLGPDAYGTGCSPGCGCPETKKDCPQWYSIAAIQASAAESDPSVLAHHAAILAEAQITAEAACAKLTNNAVQDNGGWCLVPRNDGRTIDFPHLDISYPLASGHVMASGRIVTELINLIQTENVTSINDFGAGISQYKGALTPLLPHLDYYSYDGAGNGRNYTHGMMGYFDLTIPLDLPVTDWVMSLEVGEHVPSKYEGMLIRNLHRHNRRGVILSWGVLGQAGHYHVNLHSNEYIIGVFEALGYTHDVELSKRMRQHEDNYGWFERSVMVFRRN
jgi:hypothetical protein